MKDMENNFNSLNDRERSLLMSYHDSSRDLSQLTFTERWKLRRVLREKPEAELFLKFLTNISAQVVEAVTSQNIRLNKSLWSNIDQRIDQEERAALYLGKRDLSLDRDNRGLGQLATWAEYRWAVPSAVAASLIVAGGLFMSKAGQVDSLTSRATIARSSNSTAGSMGAETSSLSRVRFASKQDDLPQIIEPSRNRPQTLSNVDVDWVHSDGAVRFLSDPERNSTMIWVKKRAPVVKFYGQQGRPNVNAAVNDFAHLDSAFSTRSFNDSGSRVRNAAQEQIVKAAPYSRESSGR